jgi:DNA repair exonuclease SbcCD ATPase subunit
MSANQVSKDHSSPEPEKPKTRWDSILTSTPVVLTIVATALAGLSSSEMTRAQYYRSLAAQHQSKAGDQWGFFQAKRIRAGNAEMEVELLRARHVLMPVTAEAIAEYAARLPQELDRTARTAERLLHALGEAKADAGSGSLRPLVEEFVRTARQKAKDARALHEKLAASLARPEVRESLAYLTKADLPEATKKTVGNAKIDEAHSDILARKTEADTASLMAKITDDELQQAMDAAASNAHAFEEKSKPVDVEIAAVTQLMKEATALAGSVHRLVERVDLALAELTAANEAGAVRVAATNDASNEVRNAAAALGRADDALTKSADEMNQSLLAARREFTARRYEREARDNQEIASVYEIQVRKSSLESERHRNRSQLFFLGMLVAQAGVTIATFSLAMRQRNVLWVLATVAGLAAIAFSGYVYLFT